MNIVNTLIAKGILPDAVIRFGIRRRLAKILRERVCADPEDQRKAVEAHAAELRKAPIAIATDEANEQHYEVPTAFYEYALGPRLKYSSAWFDSPSQSLAVAEENMLRLSCERAQLEDGQRILELGCGWGSLSLWMAEHYPNSEITVVSNSATQKAHIDALAEALEFTNLTVRTANMIHYEGEWDEVFDRVVSVEMFEHMKNYEKLLHRIAGWLSPGGKLFVHIFTHQTLAYHYEVRNDDDWMSKHFFTGGQMPSHDLLMHFQNDLKLEEDWKVSGQHYQWTAEAWLESMDAHRGEILPIFDQTYGAENAGQWWHYWRVFFMSCAELWGYRGGSEWIVSHYRFEKPQP